VLQADKTRLYKVYDNVIFVKTDSKSQFLGDTNHDRHKKLFDREFSL
jgi:hypothetical protein